MQKFGFPDLSGGSLLEQLQRTRVIRCDEAPWRFLGLSLAGYNVLISLALAAIALWGVAAAWTLQLPDDSGRLRPHMRTAGPSSPTE